MNSTRYSTASVMAGMLDESLNDEDMTLMITKFAEAAAQKQIHEKAKQGYFRCKADYEREYQVIFQNEYKQKYQKMRIMRELAAIGQMSYENRQTSMRLSDMIVPKVPLLYEARHAFGKFTRRNFIVLIENNCITVSRLYPEFIVESDAEMREVFINSWPGPLLGHSTNKQVIDYMTTIQQEGRLDDGRHQTIWQFLMKLIRQSGSLTGPDIAELLLSPEEIRIYEHDHNQPLSVLHKHLFLGKRRAAIKYAAQTRFWTLAQSLAYLDKYQSSTNGRQRLQEDDLLLMVNVEFIADMEASGHDMLLSCLFKSLLNNLLIETGRLVSPVSARTDHQFAMLLANECEINDYDTANELFRLIIAFRNRNKNHIINLDLCPASSQRCATPAGAMMLQTNYARETAESIVDASIVTDHSLNSFFPRYYGYESITSTRLMFLNEIWEYALNLSLSQDLQYNTSKTSFLSVAHKEHEFLINLVPYKLVFASRLLDYGHLDLCYRYVKVIRQALQNVDITNGYAYDQQFDQGQQVVIDQQFDWAILHQATDMLESSVRLCQGDYSVKNKLHEHNHELELRQQELIEQREKERKLQLEREIQREEELQRKRELELQRDRERKLIESRENKLLEEKQIKKLYELEQEQSSRQRRQSENFNDHQNSTTDGYHRNFSVVGSSGPFSPTQIPPSNSMQQSSPLASPYQAESQQNQSLFSSASSAIPSPQSGDPFVSSPSHIHQQVPISKPHATTRPPLPVLQLQPTQQPQRPTFPGLQQGPTEPLSDSSQHRYQQQQQEQYQWPSLPQSAETQYQSNNNFQSNPQQINNQGQSQAPTHGSSTSKDQTKDGGSKNDQGAGGLTSWIKTSLFKSNSKNEMRLPDDDQKEIVFDKERNVWVDQSKSGQENNNLMVQGPPRGGPGFGPADRQIHNQIQNKNIRYVNVWQQQQQQQARNS